MPDTLLKIATRNSPLALWQANHVKEALMQAYPRLHIELVEMTTQGDKILDTSLAKIGGKGLFVKELEQGLLEERADIAVHSMKDVPVELPEGLHLPVIMAREEPFDALVSNQYASLEALPEGAVVGTSSLRRQSQLLSQRPDLRIHTLRGNVGTRLRKLDDGDYDAIILAAAGLIRLGLEERIRARVSSDIILPAIGQGAVGIECRLGDLRVNELIAVLDDQATHYRVAAERAINRRLEGSCQTPIAGFAEIENEVLSLRGLVASPDGKQVLRGDIQGAPEEGEALGELLAADLLAQGAAELLASIA